MDWTVSPVSCPGLIYNLYNRGTTNTPDSIFSKNGNKYEINTSDKLKVGTYLLDLNGYLIGYSGVSRTV